MSLLARKLSEREVAGFPISVATSLAIESILGVHPEIPVDKPPYFEYDTVLINLRTLVRNVAGAVPTEIKHMLTPEETVKALHEDMKIIESVVAEKTDGKLSVEFYHCSFHSLQKLFPKAHIKKPQTELQLHYANLESKTIKRLIDMNLDFSIRQFDVWLNKQFKRTLLLTHTAVDLLSKKYFASLALVESHTGAIKLPGMWGTKLTNGKDMPRMPFNRLTIQVFGDNSQTFTPFPARYKNAIKELAESNNWTAVTTQDKLIHDLNKLKEKDDKILLLSLFGTA